MPPLQEEIQMNDLGLRYNGGKPALSIVPTSLSEAVAKVLMYGVQKYARDNWRKGLVWTETADCALRHLHKWLDGEQNDAESGLPHLWHLATNVAFLIEFEKQGIGRDDRFRYEPVDNWDYQP